MGFDKLMSSLAEGEFLVVATSGSRQIEDGNIQTSGKIEFSGKRPRITGLSKEGESVATRVFAQPGGYLAIQETDFTNLPETLRGLVLVCGRQKEITEAMYTVVRGTKELTLLVKSMYNRDASLQAASNAVNGFRAITDNITIWAPVGVPEVQEAPSTESSVDVLEHEKEVEMKVVNSTRQAIVPQIPGRPANIPRVSAETLVQSAPQPISAAVAAAMTPPVTAPQSPQVWSVQTPEEVVDMAPQDDSSDTTDEIVVSDEDVLRLASTILRDAGPEGIIDILSEMGITFAEGVLPRIEDGCLPPFDSLVATDEVLLIAAIRAAVGRYSSEAERVELASATDFHLANADGSHTVIKFIRTDRGYVVYYLALMDGDVTVFSHENIMQGQFDYAGCETVSRLLTSAGLVLV